MTYGGKVSTRGYDALTAADRFLVYSSEFRSLKILATYSVTGATPRNNNATFTANAGTDTLTSSGHGIQNGELVNFTSDGTLPGGIGSWDDGFFYYVVNRTTNTFQIATTPGGTPINITSSGSGTHDWWTDTSKILITHNLGYFSPWIFIYNGTASSGGTSAFMSDGLFPLDFRIYENSVEIYLGVGFGDLGDGVTVYFTCYQFLDEFTDYTASIINTGTTQAALEEEYGFAVSKETFDVLTCAEKDMIVTSNAFANIVHKKGIATANGSDPIDISHGLGYLPSFLAYLRVSGNSYLKQANDFISITTTLLSAFPDAGDKLYYVIFKQKSI